MTTLEIKTSLHKLIDSIDNETQLKKAYQLIETLSTVNEEGALWSKLSEKEQQELLEIEKESHLPGNLIDHEEMKRDTRNGFKNFVVEESRYPVRRNSTIP